ncbi:hypothetical protein COX86_01640 [Candidatus Micrarchaeota archaeon CG_4_10_14_0_2_um_filter_60_11]|nr:MAG: hypothetical protein AUJ16_03815 [Candidatus Micrarchaeota archaeon CG1_02_60_51]PIZ91069.1 MAG: hypothetical protein COX86_01640 [Candidatus Micrarchaeota archaeon CG_4_10_14_0_2_um_filter_60_11]
MEVTLDRDSFKALASEKRVQLLKALLERGKTASELARETAVSVQAAAMHLEKIEAAGLIERRRNGKWVYYDLTGKGRGVLEPAAGHRVWLTLSLGALLAVGGLWKLFYGGQAGNFAGRGETVLDAAEKMTTAAQAMPPIPAQAVDGLGLALLVAGCLLFGYSLHRVLASRRSN